MCTPGFYCKTGAAEPVPCPAGYVGSATGLYSPGQCMPVPIGFWAPLGSSIPEPCPSSGFYCPGTLRDDIHGGARPVLVPVGQSTRTVSASALSKEITLDISIDDFAAQREQLTIQLAAQYGVDLSLISLEATAGSRRARALQSSGLTLTITIATEDSSGNSVDLATIAQSFASIDDDALSTTIGRVTRTTVTVVSQPVQTTSVLVEQRYPCPKGKWCTARLVVDCPLGTYNPLEDQDFATACIMCPLNSYTRGTNSTSRAECVCNQGYYDTNASVAVDEDLINGMITTGARPPTAEEAMATAVRNDALIADMVTCALCPVGVACTMERGSTLQKLPLSPGYFRRSINSVDVRRCPDAGAGCNGTSQCPASKSGCVGGSEASPCAQNLTGLFCQLCEERRGVYYVPASSTHDAHCAPCEDTLAATVGIALAVVVVAAALAAAFALAWHRYLPERLKERLIYAYSTFAPQVKIKILVGFYMIATAVSHVYEVTLPDDTQALLHTISQLIALGLPVLFERTPLECLNLRGYTPALLFWACLPFGLVFSMLVIAMVRLLIKRNEVSVSAVFLLAIRGGALQLLFLVYPILTNKAFEAFSCHEEFEDGTSFLRADVFIECGEDIHVRAQAAAVTVMVLYPVGLLVGFSVLLFMARDDITSRKFNSDDGALLPLPPGSLSEAISFLHKEYRPALYWWELMEMLRRLVLVGVLVTFRQGSIEQLALGTLFALVYSAIQMGAAPYRKLSDNFFASACSFVLTVIFLLCVFFKYAALTQLSTLNLTPEQRNYTYALDTVMFSGVMLAACISAFFLLGVVFIAQAGDEARRMQREARAAKARRLRWVADDTEVILGPLVIKACRPTSFRPTYNMGAVAERFHIFLSHVWGTGQDQMRIVKTRLKEMLPDVVPFLDVDDLRKGKGAEYVDASSVTLIFVSYGYFISPNCLRELLRAVATDKPMITLMESEAKKGGLTPESVMQQLSEAAAPCEKNGVQHSSKYAMWDLAKEVTEWGYEMPSPGVLYAALFDKEPIEWNRIGAFQDVSMRLVAESMLPEGHAQTYLQGELTRLQPTLPEPRGGKVFHIYCSPSNSGAAGLVSEISRALGLNVEVTQSVANLDKCEQMLVYLNGLTWTSGQATDRFVNEVLQALKHNVPLLLCHEMPGVGGQAERHGCEFDLFFNNEHGATPQKLLQVEIYSQIATPLKGGAWRDVSMVMVAQALANGFEGSEISAQTATAGSTRKRRHYPLRRSRRDRDKTVSVIEITDSVTVSNTLSRPEPLADASGTGIEVAMAEASTAEVGISIHEPPSDAITVTVEGAVGAGISTRVGGGVLVTSVDAGGAAEAAGVELNMYVIAFNGTNTITMDKGEVMGLARVSQGAKTWVFAAEGMAAFAEAHAAAEEAAADSADADLRDDAEQPALASE